MRQNGTSRQWLNPAPAPSCSISALGQRGWRRALPPYDMKCSPAWLAQRACIGKSNVVACVQGFSVQHDGGRARHGVRPKNSAAASNLPMVSAPEVSLNASMFQTFALGVSPGWSPTSHQSISFAPFDIRISSGRYQQAAYDELHARSREARVMRALLARLLLRRAVVGLVYRVKTHVPYS